MSFWKLRVSSTRSVCRKTKFFRQASPICSGVRSASRRTYYVSFSYQAGIWDKARRVVAKVEWHPEELYPRVGLDPLRGSSVTNLSRTAERVVAFYNQRGTAEQHIKEGKNAINWTRLSCHGFRNNEVRLQLHVLAYNMGNYLRTLTLPDEVEHWSMTTLRA